MLSETRPEQNGEKDRCRLQHLVISICEEMLVLAKASDWAQVAELEERRILELRQYLALPVPPGEAQSTRQTIEALMSYNHRLVEMATRAREDAAQRSRQVGRAVTVSDSYDHFR